MGKTEITMFLIDSNRTKMVNMVASRLLVRELFEIDSFTMTITAAYFVAFIVLGIVTSSLGPTLPGLAKQTGVQLSQISFLFTTRSLGYMMGSFLGGRLYDRLRGHPLMGGALLIMAAALSLVPAIPLLWLLALVLLFIGIGEGLLDVGGNTLIVWLHGKKVGPFMNGLHFFFGIGAFLSPVLVAQMILFRGGIGGAYRLFALLIFPVGIWLLRLPEPKSPNYGDPLDISAPQMNYTLLWGIVIFMMLYVGAEVSYGSWIYTYGIARGISDVNAAYLTSIFWGAFTLSRLVSIPVGARVRPSRLLMANFLGALLSLGLIFFWQDNLFLLWIGSFGFGFSIAPIFPTMLTFAGNRITVTGRATGYFFLGATAGAMFLPWFIGQFFDKLGPGFAIQVILMDTFLAAGIFALIFMGGRKQSQSR
jgi:MFS transporter, FHS family, Na+ dependent glucose transporter 1